MRNFEIANGWVSAIELPSCRNYRFLYGVTAAFGVSTRLARIGDAGSLAINSGANLVAGLSIQYAQTTDIEKMNRLNIEADLVSVGGGPVMLPYQITVRIRLPTPNPQSLARDENTCDLI